MFQFCLIIIKLEEVDSKKEVGEGVFFQFCVSFRTEFTVPQYYL